MYRSTRTKATIVVAEPEHHLRFVTLTAPHHHKKIQLAIVGEVGGDDVDDLETGGHRDLCRGCDLKRKQLALPQMDVDLGGIATDDKQVDGRVAVKVAKGSHLAVHVI